SPGSPGPPSSATDGPAGTAVGDVVDHRNLDQCGGGPCARPPSPRLLPSESSTYPAHRESHGLRQLLCQSMTRPSLMIPSWGTNAPSEVTFVPQLEILRSLAE